MYLNNGVILIAPVISSINSKKYDNFYFFKYYNDNGD